MYNIVFGILAHVDAGKTTLSEGILYEAGKIRSLGRVDNRDSYFDNDELERARGITIFSKQAEFSVGSSHFTLIDTPGHVDFSAEMERTLQVLDYAVLVISAPSGIQSHTLTLWRMLRQYNIPVFIFVNKMDQPGTDPKTVMEMLESKLSDGCIDFTEGGLSHDAYENIAMHGDDERVVDFFIKHNYVELADIKKMIADRKIFPCYFGSALKLQGVKDLIKGLDIYNNSPTYGSEFSARVFKITRDSNGNRLTHMKITGGSLAVKTVISGNEKVNQIRVYSGEHYEAVDAIAAGRVCAVTGLTDSYAGQGLGTLANDNKGLIEPIITYSLIPPEGINSREIYPKLKQLEDEMPELNLEWNTYNEEILIRLMGQVQLEVVKKIVQSKFGFEPDFGMGNIVYKETVAKPVIGVGHFEPLKHYAEVHLLIEPLERGGGIIIDADLSEDILDRNWQRLILTHIREKSHTGVLTGSPLTDIKITLINGRAHKKHTEGGDFRQATYRAIRQGLMKAENVLLEPFYRYRLEVPAGMLGRAMTDVDSMHGKIDTHETIGDTAVLTGTAPVSTMRDYQINVNAYTRGMGSLSVDFYGYYECHNTDEVVHNRGYDPDSDTDNPSSSVFCAHGSGFIVPWYEVPEYMHVGDNEYGETDTGNFLSDDIRTEGFDYSIDLEEIDEILSRTYGANSRSDKSPYKKKKQAMPVYKTSSSANNSNREKLLMVDGYNIVFAWDELKELADVNIDSAKDRLIQILSNYQGITGMIIMLVFDGYKVKGNHGSISVTDNITVIHTKEGETADRYIEKFTNEKRNMYYITVATSDGLIQQITRGQDCQILSARDLHALIDVTIKELRDNYLS